MVMKEVRSPNSRSSKSKFMRNYGWASEQGPQSCGYLVPAILDVLRGLEPGNVLDLGCGNGALCRDLVAAGYEVVGVEPSSDGVAFARQYCPEAQFHQLSVDDMPDAILADHAGGFDLVVSTEVIEHLYAPRRLAEFSSGVLRPGGHLVITTPYHGYLKNLVIAVCGGWDRHADPLWDGGHIKLFSRRSLTLLLEEAGFRVIRFVGVGRVPYLWKSMVLVALKR